MTNVLSKRNLAVGLVFTLVLLVLFGSAQPIEMNIAPIAQITVNEQTNFVNPKVSMDHAFPEVIVDGCLDTHYLFDLPLQEQPQTIQLHLPLPVDLTRFEILGTEPGSLGTCEVTFGTGDNMQALVFEPRGIVRQGDQPDLIELKHLRRVQDILLTFESSHTIQINSVFCFAKISRRFARLIFLVWNLLLPACCGIGVMMSILGQGRILTLFFKSNPAVAFRFMLGILTQVALGTIWCILPRHPLPTILLVVFMLIAFLVELIFSTSSRFSSRTQVSERRLLLWVLLGSVMLLTTVMVDTYLVGNRRIVPADHLIAYQGSKYLAAEVTMDPYLSFRPWLLHILYAPIDQISGRFSYWIYLGVVASLNAFVVVPLALFSERWSGEVLNRSLGLMVLLPTMTCFHFLGQRVLAATMVMLAIYFWTSSIERRSLWGGIASGIAALAHPSALFVLPGLCLFFVLRYPFRHGVLWSFKSVCIPAVTYLCWIMFVRWQFPGVRNDLLFYPLMTNILDTFDPSLGLTDVIRSIPTDRWIELGLNRVRHLRHYIWTDSLSHPVIDVFRWISVTNVLGFTFAISLVRPSVWRLPFSFVWLGILGPLLVHHLYVGQSNAFFHMAPLAFFSMTLVVALRYGRTDNNLTKIVIGVGLLELFFRQCYPITFAGLYTSTSWGLWSTDTISYVIVASLQPILWLTCATLAFTPELSPDRQMVTPSAKQ